MDKKTIEQVDKTLCCGCGLCAVKCPKGSIAMVTDAEGFRVPKVDEATCINCGICLKNCTVTDAAEPLYHKGERHYFTGIIKDEEKLILASSGGVFGALAEKIVAEGGYVVGCAYNEDVEAVHKLTDCEKDIESMYGSKYVQSRAEDSFKDVAEKLSEGKTVLFTGTGCQIAALRLYLGKDYDHLYLVEILCHGVPAPKLLRIYKEHLEKKLRAKVLDIRFRDKRRDGWGSEHRTCVIYEKNGKIKELRPVLPAYFSAFFYGVNLRESCYKCRFARSERVADLTIGDFWGSYAKYKKRFTEGISVVGVNTGKGQALADKIREDFSFYDELSEEEAVRSNDNFEHPIGRPVERSDFYKGVYEKGYRGLWKKAYLTKTYRRKTLASFYGAFVPEKLRFAIQKVKQNIRF